jgi:hypothetical protein
MKMSEISVVMHEALHSGVNEVKPSEEAPPRRIRVHPDATRFVRIPHRKLGNMEWRQQGDRATSKEERILALLVADGAQITRVFIDEQSLKGGVLNGEWCVDLIGACASLKEGKRVTT